MKERAARIFQPIYHTANNIARIYSVTLCIIFASYSVIQNLHKHKLLIFTLMHSVPSFPVRSLSLTGSLRESPGITLQYTVHSTQYTVQLVTSRHSLLSQIRHRRTIGTRSCDCESVWDQGQLGINFIGQAACDHRLTCIFNLGSLFSRLSHYIYQWP